MKKIIRILKDGTEQLAGYAVSIHAFLLEHDEADIRPLHGKPDYIIIHNVYCEENNQLVTYRAE